ncbi:MAG: helix-turn-helix domain-containing protein [Bacteroidetes bacterium]|nr:helix-turn-helix domain-containing protein [Bacteroidota bacterium]
MSTIIVTTPDELQSLIRDAVRAEIAQQKEHYTVDEAAVYLGMSVSRLYQISSIQNPVIPSVQVGRMKRFLRKDLDRYLQANTRRSVGDAKSDAAARSMREKVGKGGSAMRK